MHNVNYRLAQRQFLFYIIEMAKSHLEILKDWKSIDLFADNFGIDLSPNECKIILKYLKELYEEK